MLLHCAQPIKKVAGPKLSALGSAFGFVLPTTWDDFSNKNSGPIGIINAAAENVN